MTTRPFSLSLRLPTSAHLDAYSLFAPLADDELPFLLDGETSALFGSEPKARLVVHSADDPLAALEDFVREHSPQSDGPSAETTETARIVGYLSYDIGRTLEALPDLARDDLRMPLLCFAAYRASARFDRRSGELTCVGEDEAVTRRLAQRIGSAAAARRFEPAPARAQLEELRAEMSYEAYTVMVRRALEWIRAGDIYQVNLSQRFRGLLGRQFDSFDRYVFGRRAHPTQFGAYLPWDEHTISCGSPERFLRFDPRSRRIETMPIKGTLRRTAGEDEERRVREFVADGKERAEHLMIVDLERNDLGRICNYGSVHVQELAAVERYSTLYHLVSTVEGVVRPEVGLAAMLRATCPGGSITGAPKIRAMQIIETLEPTRRGLYTGSIGYFGWNGAFDFNIAIRTAIVYRDELYLQVGGGIVADSLPEREYQETLTKAESWRALPLHARPTRQ